MPLQSRTTQKEVEHGSTRVEYAEDLSPKGAFYGPKEMARSLTPDKTPGVSRQSDDKVRRRPLKPGVLRDVQTPHSF